MLPTWAIQVIFIVSLVAGGYSYFLYTTNKIEDLRTELTLKEEEVSDLQNDLRNREQVIGELQGAIEKDKAAYKELSRKFDVAEEYQDSLLRKLHRHDLTKLTAAKPGLIERRINEGTKDIFDELESITAKQ